MLKNDMFNGAEMISREHFMTVRSDSPNKNTFWRMVSLVAVEKLNMQEVFNMSSTVRLTAIEKLCECVCGGGGWGVCGWGVGGVYELHRLPHGHRETL